jgi:DedD protein
MPLSSLLERFRRGANGTTPGARAPSPSDVEALRTRARRRLIGMVVLVGAGVLGFPWLFETQPRPMSPDVRIVQSGPHAQGEADASSRAASGRVSPAPRREAQVANITPPADATNAPPPAEARQESRAQAQAEAVQPAPKPAPKPSLKPSTGEPARQPEKVAAKPAEKAPEKSPEKVAQKPQAKPAEKSADKATDKKPDPKPDNKASDTRYVVQFGAFADVNAARETRQKAERMGLKTYAQQVDTPQGKRIRVRLGPFADKAEADKALATLRKGGLNGNVLTL